MESKPIYFILAGQSNAGGRAFSTDLSQDMQKEYPNVMMKWNNDLNFGDPAISNDWKPLQPQYTPFVKKKQFGPEIMLGRKLYESLKRPIYIIKFTMGSTNLFVNWNPDCNNIKIGKNMHINYFKEFNKFCQDSINSIKEPADFGGIFWMQGEGDAMDNKFANAYYENIKLFVAKLRELFGDCLFIAGFINWPAKFQNIVNDSMNKLATEDKKFLTVKTDDFTRIGYSYDKKYNNNHFDADSLNKLGSRMAEAYSNFK